MVEVIPRFLVIGSHMTMKMFHMIPFKDPILIDRGKYRKKNCCWFETLFTNISVTTLNDPVTNLVQVLKCFAGEVTGTPTCLMEKRQFFFVPYEPIH